MSSKDNFGDRMKRYERDSRFMPFVPIVVRIDGKGFSKWTKGLPRPYSEGLTKLMVAVTKKLVEDTQAKIGYTQSDEITLVYYSDQHNSDIYLHGREQKMTSILASMATAYFNHMRAEFLSDFKADKPAMFDCRVFAVPTRSEAANAVLWREQDATKNAISMAASAYFTHSSLQGLSGAEMQEKLWSEEDVNFNDFPSFFKRGTFVQRRTREVELDEATLAQIPEGKRPTGPVTRSSVETLNMPRFGSVANRIEVIFEGAEPELITEDK